MSGAIASAAIARPWTALVDISKMRRRGSLFWGLLYISAQQGAFGRRAHLEVVGAHEQVGYAGAHDAEDPLVKVLGLALGDSIGNLGLRHACQAFDLQEAHLSSQLLWLF